MDQNAHHSCQKVWLAELRMLDGSLVKPWNDLLKILSFTFIATVIKWMLMVNESCLAKMQQIMVWTWHLIFFLKLAILIFHLYSMRLILRILQNLRTSWEFGLQLRRGLSPMYQWGSPMGREPMGLSPMYLPEGGGWSETLSSGAQWQHNRQWAQTRGSIWTSGSVSLLWEWLILTISKATC